MVVTTKDTASLCLFSLVHYSHMHPDLTQTIRQLKTPKPELVLQILLVFIAPVLLIRLDIIPISLRVPLLVVLVTTLVGIVHKEKWTFQMLGLVSRPSPKEAFAYSIFTIIGVIVISQVGELIGKEEITHWWMHQHFLYLFIVVSVFQEIAYRGFLIPALGKLMKSKVFLVLTNAFLFMFLHIIFPDLYIGLPLAFIGGIGFALMYLRYPNLPMIIVSHAVLNFTAVLYGFFAIPGVTY